MLHGSCIEFAWPCVLIPKRYLVASLSCKRDAEKGGPVLRNVSTLEDRLTDAVIQHASNTAWYTICILSSPKHSLVEFGFGVDDSAIRGPNRAQSFDTLLHVSRFDAECRKPWGRLDVEASRRLGSCRKQAKQGVALLQGAPNLSRIGKRRSLSPYVPPPVKGRAVATLSQSGRKVVANSYIRMISVQRSA